MKAEMVVMSHLSDMQETLNLYSNINYEDFNEIINFVKYIIFVTKGDLKQEIDPDELYAKFLKKFKKG